MKIQAPPTGRIALTVLPERYEVIRQVGRGATGTVYLARDTFADRDVALKVAHPEIFGDDLEQGAVRKAWLNEVRLAGTLQHPYIVQVFDAGIGENMAYLAMEYLPEGTLDRFTKPDTLKPVGEVLEIAYKCASALDYACRAGIIHRDIKPANLQYVGVGQAKVADFGAAYWSRGDTTQVMDICSLAYMAPELFRQVITPQADIYALGVVLFQLLSGSKPFEAQEQAALMYKIINGDRPALRDLRPDLPDGVDAVLDRMIAPDPAARFPGWQQTLSALSALSPRLESSSADEQPAESELFHRLRGLEVLSPLNDAELWQLLRISRWYKVAPGTALVHEGAEAKSCYLLLSGKARVTHKGKLINQLSTGTIFGELAFADTAPLPRVATVSADGPVTIGRWPFSALRAASSELQMKMLQIFFRLAAERLKQANQQLIPFR